MLFGDDARDPVSRRRGFQRAGHRRALPSATCYFFRGTPLLAQLFLIYYGAGQFVGSVQGCRALGFPPRRASTAPLFAFTLNTAAYQARDLPRRDPLGAARSMGGGAGARAPSPSALLKVILPQAAIVALRPIGNEMILMIKASAVASIVTVLDLMGETKLAFSRSYDLTIYLYAAVLYLILVEAIRRVWNRLDARLTRHLRREARPHGSHAADVTFAAH